MNKKQLKKNKLDLEYHSESQKANAFLILLTTGILSFFGTFIWLKGERVYSGITIALIVLIVGMKLYQNSSIRMKEILKEIDKI